MILSSVSNLEFSDPEISKYLLSPHSSKIVSPSKSELYFAPENSVVSQSFDLPMNICFG